MSWAEVVAHVAENDARATQREKDLKMLGRILDNDADLTASEAIAFGEMQAYVAAGESRSLSVKQREWAKDVDERVSEGEYENGWSSGAVPSGEGLARPGRVHHFEQMARPLKPPGRR